MAANAPFVAPNAMSVTEKISRELFERQRVLAGFSG